MTLVVVLLTGIISVVGVVRGWQVFLGFLE